MPSAFEEKVMLNEQRLETMRCIALNNTVLSKKRNQLEQLKNDIESCKTSYERCLKIKKYLMFEAQVALLSEYERVRDIMKRNDSLIPDMKYDIYLLTQEIKELESESKYLKDKLQRLDNQISNFGKVLFIHAHRKQKAPRK
ncbi:MAG: hypothetical protein EB078_08570 [Proteobacteria bacterium]|nr:hypothetical protein [Pseudomonadota bacterium]NDD04946.1 hypothetical protein [Pseudomonadota bacterium]NDG28030.1 hypothetical protein [Pseudomonadota bacterium]